MVRERPNLLPPLRVREGEPGWATAVIRPVLVVTAVAGTVLAAGFGIAFLLDLFPRTLPGVASGVSLVALAAVCEALARRGHPRLANALLFTAIWLLITASMVLFGGWNSVAFCSYLTLMVFLGFVAGVRALVLVGAASSAAMFAVAVAARGGWLPPFFGPPDPLNAWLVATAALAVIALLVRHGIGSTLEAVREARQNEATAVAATREVEAGRILLERRARQQATVAELGRLALEDTPPTELIDRGVEAVAHMIDVEMVAALELLPDGETLRLLAGAGWGPEMPDRVTVSLSQAGQAEYALRTDAPVVVEDLENETRFTPSPLLLSAGVRSGVSVVIRGSTAPFGLLSAHARACRRYSEDDVHFLQSVANLFSLVIRRSETDERLRERDEQLRQAQKMEAIGQLAGGIAHDFNNLLQAILGFSGILLRRHGEGDEDHPDLQEVQRAAERAATLTRQLLAFSRRQVLDPVDFDLNSLISNLTQLLGRLLGAHIALRFEPADCDTVVHADAGQLEQVVINLCINARDAMLDGGTLTLRTRIVENPFAAGPMRTAVELSVEDTGCGIDPQAIDHIFEPFFTTKQQSEGTGLGLATVYGIVQQHGGTIQVEAGTRGGTVFRVQLPWVGRVAVPQELLAEPEPPRGDSRCVLVAEDDGPVRALTSQVLVEAGYRVITARNGREAIALFQAHPDGIEVAVLDIVMPQMSGIDAAARMREQRPDLPIVFCSGYGFDAAGRAPQLDERTSLLTKPYQVTDLLRCVGAVLAVDPHPTATRS